MQTTPCVFWVLWVMEQRIGAQLELLGLEESSVSQLLFVHYWNKMVARIFSILHTRCAVCVGMLWLYGCVLCTVVVRVL